jgi:hypothetical protein
VDPELNGTAQTNVTVTTIVRQLYCINNTMEEVKYNVLAFNTKVRLLLNQHVANTGSEFDRTILLTSLFEAYKLPTNQEFNTLSKIITSTLQLLQQMYSWNQH